MTKLSFRDSMLFLMTSHCNRIPPLSLFLSSGTNVHGITVAFEYLHTGAPSAAVTATFKCVVKVYNFNTL
jgi:hypothetical protein